MKKNSINNVAIFSDNIEKATTFFSGLENRGFSIYLKSLDDFISIKKRLKSADLIILDIHFNSFQDLLGKIGEWQQHSQLPMIAIIEKQIEEEFKKANKNRVFDSVLIKPIDINRCQYIIDLTLLRTGAKLKKKSLKTRKAAQVVYEEVNEVLSNSGQEIRYKMLFESAYDAIFLMKDDRFIDCNLKAANMFGCSRDELLSKKPTDFSPARQTNGELSSELAIKKINDALIGEPQFFEWKHQQLDGTLFDAEVSLNRLEIDGKYYLQAIVRDVSDRKSMLNKLLESEKRFRVIAENITDMISRNKPDGSYIYTSPSCKTLLGYEPDELEGKKIYEFIHQEDLDKVKNLFSGIIENNSNNLVTYRIRKNDGSYIWFESKGNTIFDETNDKRREVHLFSRDVTDRQLANSALNESEVKYRSLFEWANDGILLIQGENIIDCNATLLSMLGISRQSLLKKKLLDFSPHRQPDGIRSVLKMEEKIENAYRGYVQLFEWQFERSDASRFDTEVSLSRVEIRGESFLQTIIRDVSERRKAEISIKNSEEKYRRVIENANEAIFIIQDGSIKFCNPKMVELMKYDPKMLEATQYIHLIYPEDRTIYLDKIKQNYADKSSFSGQSYRIVSGKGEIKWIEVNGIYIEWEGRQATLNFANDITERKSAEELLRLSEEKFFKVFSTSPDAININRLSDGYFIDINDGFTSLTGYTKDDVKGKSSLQINIWADPVDREKLINGLKQNGEVTNLEAYFKLKNGEIKTGLMSARIIQVDGEPSIISITRDISDRKRAQEQLRLSEEKYRTITRCVPDIIWTSDLEGNFTYINSSVERTHGWSVEEILKLSIKDILKPEDSIKVKKIIETELIRSQDPDYDHNTIHTLELQQIRKDGSIFPSEVAATLLWSDSGNPIGIIGMTRDISDRKQSENIIQKNEQKYRSFFEKDISGIYLSTLEGKLKDCNISFVEMFGYTTPQEIMSINTRDLYVKPGDREKFIQRLQEEKTLFNIEIEMKKKDGNVISCMENVVGNFDENGKLVSFQGYMIDITERKNSDREKERNISLLKATLESTADGILVVDQSGKIADFNKRFVQMWQIPGEIISLRDDQKAIEFVLSQLANPDDFLSKVKELYSKPEAKSFDLLTFKDGRCFERYSRPQRMDGKPVGRVWSFRDVTKRNQTEKALAESEEKFRSIAEQSKDLFALTDDVGMITYASPISMRLFGVGPDEMVGKHFTSFLDESVVQKAVNEFKDAVEKGIDTVNLELVMKRKDGSLFIGELNGTRFNVESKGGVLVTIRDITDRKKGENELRESESKFRTIIEQSSEGFTLTDEKGKIIEWNSSQQKITGLNKSEVLGEPLASVMVRLQSPEKRNENEIVRINKLLEEALKNGKSYLFGRSFEIEILTPDKQKRLVLQTAFPIETEKGFRIGSVTIDVTESRAQELELKKSEERFRALIQNSNDGIVLLDQSGKIIYESPAVLKINGYNVGDRDGKPIFDLLHPDWVPTVHKLLEEINSEPSKAISVQVKIQSKSNGWRWIDVNAKNMMDIEGVNAIVANIRDITEKKEIEESIKILVHTIRSTSEAICITDIDGIIIYVNDAFVKVYGYLENELIGKNIDIVHSSIVDESVYKSIYLETSTKGWQGEIINIRKDGSEFPVYLSSSAVRDEGGRVVAHVGIASDITERKKSEDAIRESEARWRTMMESAPGLVHLINKEGKILFINQPTPGFKKDEVEGSTIYQYVKPEIAKFMSEQVAKVFNHSETVSFEVPAAGPYGEEAWFACTIGPVKKGDKINQAIMHSLNISERKEAENALRTSEERYKAFIEYSSEGISRVEVIPPVSLELSIREQAEAFFKNAIIAECNNAFAKMYGFERAEQLVGMKVYDLWSGSHEEKIAALTPWLEANCYVENFETKEIGKEGSELFFLNNSFGIFLNGELVRHWGTQRDITAWKKAQEALKVSESYLRAIVNSAKDSIFIKDKKFKYLLVNNSMSKLFDIPANDFIGKDDSELFGGVISLRTSNEDNQVLSGKTIEFEAKEKISGVEKTFHIIKVPLVTEAGEIVGVCGISRDITERKQEQDQLYQSQQMLQLVIDNIPQRVFWKDKNFRYMGSNKAFANDAGFDDKKMIEGKLDTDLTWKSVAAIYQADDENVMRSGVPKYNYEEPQHFMNGPMRWLKTSKVPLKNSKGEIVGVLGTYEDITGTKHTEEQLRKLSRAVEQSPNSTVITDHTGVIEYINPKFTELTGYTLEDTVGKTPSILKSGETSDVEYKKLWETIKSGHEWRGEFLNKKKDGSLYWEYASISPIIDSEGVITHYVAVKEDITEKKQLEQQLYQAQKLESIGTLVSGISHDFNNILNNIVGFAGQLKKYANDHARVLKYSETVEKSALRGSDLAMQLLSLARRSKAEKHPVNVISIIDEVVSLCVETFPKNITIEKHLPENLPSISGQRGELYQAVLNMCLNARDAMPNGGSLSLGASYHTSYKNMPAHLMAFTDAKVKSFIQIEISDTGVGIPDNIKDRIFDPFFTTKERGQGTGLGLSVVYNIIRNHKGIINMESKVNYGSKFNVYLPVVEEEIKPDQPLALTHRTRGDNALVLLVDDEQSMRELGMELLEEEGYKVLTAGDGEEALNIYRQQANEIQLVILDLVMPKMDGGQAYLEMKKINPNIKAFFCTGYASDEVISNLLKDENLNALQKPLRSKDFLSMVRKVIAGE